MLNRPNRNGSLLSPIGWMALAITLSAVGVALTSVAIVRGQYQLLAPSVGLFALAYGSVIAGSLSSTGSRMMSDNVSSHWRGVCRF
jgi:hypothetical protein